MLNPAWDHQNSVTHHLHLRSRSLVYYRLCVHVFIDSRRAVRERVERQAPRAASHTKLTCSKSLAYMLYMPAGTVVDV